MVAVDDVIATVRINHAADLSARFVECKFGREHICFQTIHQCRIAYPDLCAADFDD